MTEKISRRSFNKAAVAGAAISSFSILSAHAQGGGKEFKAALIGCGGRGNGAANQLMEAAAKLGLTIKWVACAEWFEDKAKRFGKAKGIPENMCFSGARGYKKVMESDADIVLMATPPAFRPIHFEAAVEAGKHCFIEKPVAVDPQGARRVMAAGEKAKKKGLAVVAGTQRRHTQGYRTAVEAVLRGDIGKIVNGQIYWLGRVPWVRKRSDGQSDADYLVNNWVNWAMMSGDHICEQHVHQIDIANWVVGRPPVMANGFGGRHRRTSGDQFDFFSIDFDYGENVHIHSMCRQNAGCYTRIGETFAGTEGTYSGRVKRHDGKNVAVDASKYLAGNGQMVEHYDMLKSIIDGKPLNEAENVANATMAAIMGQISAYTGQVVRWSDVMTNEKSKFYNRRLTPTAEDFEKGEVVAPQDDVIPIPPCA